MIALPAPLHASSDAHALPPAPVTIGIALTLALLVGAGVEALAATITLMLGGYAVLKAAGAVRPLRSAALLALSAALLVPGETVATAIALLALAAALDRRHPAMMALAGLACGLGVVAAAALFLALAIARQLPLRLYVVSVAIATVTRLSTMPDATMSALGLPDHLLGPGLAIGAGALAAFVAQASVLLRSDRALLPAALLVALMMSAISPFIGAPTGVLSAALGLAVASTIRSRTNWSIAGLALTIAFAFALHTQAGAWIGVLIALGTATLVARPLLKPAANDNPLLARAA